MKRLLFFLSKTDRKAIAQMPQSANNHQLALGVLVLLTGISAFISGSYAISTMLTRYDPLSHSSVISKSGIWFSLILGFFYSCFIMTIDREIVSAPTKMAALFRLPLAFIISISISVPIELRLVEGRIEKQLLIDFHRENAAVANKRDSILKAYNEGERKRDSIKLFYRNEITRIQEQIHNEQLGVAGPGLSGRRGDGWISKQLKDNLAENKMSEERANNELEAFKKEKDGYMDEAGSIFSRDSIPQAYDFLSRYIALNAVIENDSSGSARRMCWGISIFFIVLELTPAFIKLIAQKTEYDAYIETRRRLNIQLMHVTGGNGMEQMETDIDYTNSPQYTTRIKSGVMH